MAGRMTASAALETRLYVRSGPCSLTVGFMSSRSGAAIRFDSDEGPPSDRILG